jgi:hypothetical protein
MNRTEMKLGKSPGARIKNVTKSRWLWPTATHSRRLANGHGRRMAVTPERAPVSVEK